LEIIDSKVNIRTEIEDDIPSITVKVKTSSNIGEMQGQLDVFDKKSISQLEKQQADEIRAEMESAISFSKQNNTDILGFGDKLFHQHPMKWERIKDNWDKLFPKIKVKIEIEAKINRSYNIGKPIRNWEEKEKPE
jgi:spore germination protein KC